MRRRTVWLVAIFTLLAPIHLRSEDWRVRPGTSYGHDPTNSWSIVVRGKPQGEIEISCTRAPQIVEVTFRGCSRKRRLKLGFSRKVQTEDGGLVLRHSVHDPKYIGSGSVRNRLVQWFEGSALDVVQRLYHSQSVSWGPSKRGKPLTATTGDSARRAIDEMLGFCGMSLADRPPALLALAGRSSAGRGETPSASGPSQPSKSLKKQWRVRPGTPYGHDPANSWSIVVRGKPKGKIILLCTRTPRMAHVLTSGGSRKRRMKLGFSRKVQTEDGGFVLRHSVHDPEYIGPGKIRNTPTSDFEGNPYDTLQRIYHSESVSLGNPKQPKTITTGDIARRAIDELLDFCGISPPPEPEAGRFSPDPSWLRQAPRQEGPDANLPSLLDSSSTSQAPEQADLDVSLPSRLDSIEKNILANLPSRLDSSSPSQAPER